MTWGTMTEIYELSSFNGGFNWNERSSFYIVIVIYAKNTQNSCVFM